MHETAHDGASEQQWPPHPVGGGRVAPPASPPARSPRDVRCWLVVRVTALALALVLGASLSLYVFASARQADGRVLSARVERSSHEVAASVGRAFAQATGELEALAVLVGSSGAVEARAFQRIARQLSSRRQDGVRYEWIPAARGRRAGGEPPAEADAGRAMARAARTGRPAALRPASTNDAAEPEVLVFAPVYRGSAGPRTAPARRAQLEGFVVGAYRLARIAERALSSAGADQAEIRLYDDEAPPGERLVYVHPARAGAEVEATAAEVAPGRGPHRDEVVQLADRSWRVVTAPPPEVVRGAATWAPWISLAAGLLLTALLARYALALLRRVAAARARADRLQRERDELERQLMERRMADGARSSREDDLRRMALHDSLTQLPNRVLLTERFEQILAGARHSGRTVAVALLDLDHFKDVNDRLGHDAGDELLRRVARRLAASTREHDVVGRLGGDEFLVVLGELNAPEDARSALERLLAALREPLQLEGHAVQPSASVGVALHPRDGDVPEVLLKNADVALYRAKADGRGCWRCFQSDMAEVAKSRVDTAAALRRALEQGELVVHYQPVLDLDLGRVTGVEALLRWRTPAGELLPASSFLPVAEETGLIVPIGRWGMREACRQAAAWARSGMPMRLAVNLGARELAEEDAVDAVAAALGDAGLAPELLEVELPESALVRRPEQAQRLLSSLRARGVGVVIDDFGSGYSSLSRLRSLPIDGLKLDGAFLRDAATRPGDRSLLQAIVGLAHSLGMSVIAKAVETEAQLELLRDLAVPWSDSVAATRAQGFLIGQPMLASGVEELIGRRGAAEVRPARARVLALARQA